MRRDQIRTMLKTAGLAAVVGCIDDLLEGRKLDNGAQYKLSPEQFSIREVWEGFVGDAEDTLPSYNQSLIREEVNTTGFNAITRLLLANMVIGAYNSVETIGDKLVTNMPSKRKVENIPGFTESEGLKDVPESMPYEDSGLGEKYVTTQAGKRGRMIYVTEEMIMEDQTNQILMRAQRIGQMARIDKEKVILNGVLDKFGSVYRPSGVATSLYSTGHGNLMGDAGSIAGFTTAEALVDWTDIDKVEQFHPLSIKDDRQVGDKDPILWVPKILLVPKGLNAIGLRIRNATEIRTTSNNELTIFNNPKAGMFDVLSSPFIALSGIAGAAADWYYGDFKAQFHWQDVWPIQVFSQGKTSEAYWERDIAAAYKVRYYGGMFATDHRHVVKVKGS